MVVQRIWEALRLHEMRYGKTPDSIFVGDKVWMEFTDYMNQKNGSYRPCTFGGIPVHEVPGIKSDAIMLGEKI